MIAIAGLQKTTLLDYPGKLAAVLFLRGCNLRCPFCHNAPLTECGPGEIDEADVFTFLEKRRKLLDGVCLTGGEPLLQPELPELIRRIRSLGLSVKLDTNGTLPDRLGALLKEGLLDYVAMDIKNAPERYAETTGVRGIDISRIMRSASLLLESGLDFEFRTTVVHRLHDLEDFEKIGQWLRGDEKYFLQCFVPNDAVFDQTLTAPSREFLSDALAVLRRTIPRAALRGTDAAQNAQNAAQKP